jgi:preprotein translocase subunit SecA
MTGTAMTEADEFAEIYKLEVIEVPTNVAVARKDQDDEVYRSAVEKYEAVANLIEECRARGQPALVGTTSIEKSEVISGILTRKKVPHKVLNARFHEQEAGIVAQAGSVGAVTIATNMAGRGTDIKLGGNLEMRLKLELADMSDPELRAIREAEIRDEIADAHAKVKIAGGLFVIGTERHESRRIDNQLRGRSGRQGDPGGSRFFLSLEDDLMRIFGSDRMAGMLGRLGLKDGEAIVHPWINKALEKAQKKVEARNFDMRKNVLKYDDVMNDQRREVYAQRREFMKADDVSETVADMRADVISALVLRRVPERAFAEQWESDALAEDCRRMLMLELPIADWSREDGIDQAQVLERVERAADALMAAKAANFGPELMRYLEKSMLLQMLDAVWKEHLLALDHLRQGIGLRAYGQRDPLNEYKNEAFTLFNAMLDELKERVTVMLARVQMAPELPPDAMLPPTPTQMTIENHPAPAELEMAGAEAQVTTLAPRSDPVDPNDPQTWANASRNSLCPCGSGKKFKHCHGRTA